MLRTNRRRSRSSLLELAIKEWSLAAALLIDAAAVLIIVLSFIVALGAGIIDELQPGRDPHLRRVRMRLGRHLALALEFMIAGDIVRTAVAPSWTELGQLGAIVILRVVITAALDREIRNAEIDAVPASVPQRK
jgi:uncharacterized membrane protein